MSAAQLAELNVSTRTVADWVQAAYLHPVLPTVYGVGHRAESSEADLAGALLFAGPGAMLSHATAAWWYGLIDYRPSIIEVRTPRRCKSLNTVVVHDRCAVRRTWHNRLPITAVSQTFLDFAASAPEERVRTALATAEYRGLIDMACLESECGRGRQGSATLRRAIKNHQPRFAHTRSELENALIRLCEQYDIPLPELNVSFGRWLLDAVWPDRRVVVELDGYDAHRTRAQLERDHERDLQLRAAGFVVVRYTWDQLTRRPQAVAGDLRRMLQQNAA